MQNKDTVPITVNYMKFLFKHTEIDPGFLETCNIHHKIFVWLP